MCTYYVNTEEFSCLFGETFSTDFLDWITPLNADVCFPLLFRDELPPRDDVLYIDQDKGIL